MPLSLSFITSAATTLQKTLKERHYALLRGYKQYTYIKLYKSNRYLQYLLEYVLHSSGYNN